MKSKNIKIKVISEADFIKAIKKYSREQYGFEAPKIFRNKKKYNRKTIKPIKLDN